MITRNDVLTAQLEDIKVDGGGCTVLSGVLDPDPYTGKTIRFRRGPGTSTKIQIDHVVALGAAWRTGAAEQSPAERALLANHSLNLLAVDGPTNMGKGDDDAAEWLPPNESFACAYVAQQIAVKAEFELWVTRAEEAAMERTHHLPRAEVADTVTRRPRLARCPRPCRGGGRGRGPAAGPRRRQHGR